MPIQPQQTGLYEGLILSDLKNRSLDRLKIARGNYDRYSAATILDALIDSEVEAARLTKCIRSFAFIVLKEGYAQYRPPSNFLMLDKVFFYKSNTNYYELKQKTRRWLDKHKRGWRTVTGDSLITFPGDNYGNMRKIGVYPTPDTDSGFEIDPDTGAYERSSAGAPSGNVSGANEAAHATICTKAAGDFINNGVQVGMMALNVTDGSSGQISAVSSTTFTVTLTGGTNNTWALGDSFTILAGEYGVVTDWDTDESYVFTTDYGVMTGITNENNLYVEYFRRPIPLQYDGQYPEIPPELHQYLPDNVVYLLKRNAPKGSGDYNEAVIGRQAFLNGIFGYDDLDDSMEDDVAMDWSL